MTGSPFSWERTSDKPEEARTSTRGGNDYIDYSYARYMGGYPHHIYHTDTGVYFYNDRLEIVDPDLVIFYSSITRIENVSEEAVDRGKVVEGLIFFTPLAINALIHKKKYTYTVIQYREEGGNKETPNVRYTIVRDLSGYTTTAGNTGNKASENDITIILDFDVDVYRVQPLIYNKMIEAKRK